MGHSFRVDAPGSSGLTGDLAVPDEHQRAVNQTFESRLVKWRTVYEDRTVFGVIHQQRLEANLQWIDALGLHPGERVLEVGCGAGLTTVALAQRGYLVEALDTVPGMLATTRRGAAEAGVAERVTTRIGDAHQLEFADASFALVVAMGVIPWLHSPRQALSELSRVLAPGGYLLVNNDNRWRLAHLLDPALCPALALPRRAAAWLLRPRRRPAPTPPDAEPRRYSAREFDAWIAGLGLRKLKGLMLGYGPFTLWWRHVLPEALGIRLHHVLQACADRNVIGIRATGSQYIVLARKPER